VFIYDRTGNRLQTIRDKAGRVLHDLGEEDAMLDGLDLRDAQLSGIVAEGLMCMNTRFNGANLAGADLYWAMAQGADFAEADLGGASLRGANLRDCNFAAANLAGADLSSDNLGGSTRMQGADLTGAALADAKLRSAEFDGRTRFPHGFDPLERGMVKVD
jgi:uncharacterized protein YjbI with pentapeptide repeats